MSLASFALASLLVLVTPGPTNTILAASGAALGLRRAALLPAAEAIGYAVAISAFLMAAEILAGVPAAMSIVKGIAALWLFFSAVRLWSRPVVPDMPAQGSAFMTVLLTTMLNPKALLVGTILIPGMLPDRPAIGIAAFMTLSILAGLGWTALGALLPPAARRYSYKGAALVIAGFGIAAAVSAVSA